MSSFPADERPTVDFAAPNTAAETRAILEDGPPETTLVAGGQSVSLALRQGLIEPTLLVDISGVPEYGGIAVGRERVEIGATTTYAELAAHELATRYPILTDALSIIGDVQVRNRGTVGGAIGQADPAYDILPPLLALDATVTIGSAAGERLLPLADLFTGESETVLNTSELVEAVTFDPRAIGSSCYCSQATVTGGRSTVGVGVDIRFSDANSTVSNARIALGAVAPTPVRAPTAERILIEADTEAGMDTNTATGSDSDSNSRPNPEADTDSEMNTDTTLSPATVQAAADAVVEDIDPVDDLYGSRAYKQQLATVLTYRAIETAVERAGGSVE